MEVADVKSLPGWANGIRGQICVLELANRCWSFLTFDLNILVKSSGVCLFLA